jgi:hypothetical protein
MQEIYLPNFLGDGIGWKLVYVLFRILCYIPMIGFCMILEKWVEKPCNSFARKLA